jgi:glycosyltransferase involved in cell wall biosynthesis
MLQVWQELKAENPEFDAILEMKTATPGLHPSLMEVVPDLVIHQGGWPRQKVVDWYGTIDVLVSTSRGEGNNKPAMEFMCTGGPVIATNWSGHQNWLHSDWGWPVDGDLVANSVGVSDFRLQKDSLKAAILEAWSNPALRRKKGRLSRGVMLSSFGWEEVVTRLVKKVVAL